MTDRTAAGRSLPEMARGVRAGARTVRSGRRLALVLVFASLAALGAWPAEGGAHTWSITRMDPKGGGLTSISCPSVRLCVAGDSSLHLISTTHPLGGRMQWHGFKGRGYPGNGGNPNDYFGQPGWYTGVSCPSVKLCIAVDDSGEILASRHPASGRRSWYGALVDCGECMMANDGSFSDVSCTPARVCVAVDPSYGVYTTHAPFNLDSWNPGQTFSGAPYGVSCGPGLCVLFGDASIVYTSTDPAASNPAWQKASIDPGHNINGVSCPTRSLCVAVDAGGNVLTSTDPTAAAPQWTLAGVDGSTPLEGVSCPTASLCVAIDHRGNALSSTLPTGGPRAWRLTKIDFNRFLTSISCPSTALCVAVDAHGDAISTKHPAAPARR